MNTSSNYDLKIYEGTDIFNPLTVENDNIEAIDEIMYANQQAGISLATESVTGTVHAITRGTDSPMFRFVATGDYVTGDTFTVDGSPVTAKLPNGSTLGSGAYVINSNVLCCLVGTLLTVFTTGGGTSANSLKLGGELPSYYAKASDLTAVESTASGAASVANDTKTALTSLVTATLSAGQTSVTIYNAAITPNSIIEPFYKVTGGVAASPINYKTIQINNGSVVMTFDALESSITVAVRVLNA